MLPSTLLDAPTSAGIKKKLAEASFSKIFRRMI